MITIRGSNRTFMGRKKLLEMLKLYLAEDMEAFPVSTVVNKRVR